ncbi:hypothetical protein V1514DRAFT_320469 [Lipomyces japonicus]|uniref:uncharacterized protein n=1 Tax=Lipomyces japonicus TaxID=56871 RepID=UPI0034D016E9
MSVESSHRSTLIRILHLSLLRADTARSSHCLALLLRTAPAVPRKLGPVTTVLLPFWTEILECLQVYHGHQHHHHAAGHAVMRKRRARTRRLLLEWMLVAFSHHLRASAREIASSERKQRAQEYLHSFLYAAIVDQRVSNNNNNNDNNDEDEELDDVREMIDRLEEVILEWPFSEDVRLRAYLAMGLQRVGRTIEAVKEFETCKKLGWTPPEFMMSTNDKQDSADEHSWPDMSEDDHNDNQEMTY